jgi:hypothetical protein
LGLLKKVLLFQPLKYFANFFQYLTNVGEEGAHGRRFNS